MCLAWTGLAQYYIDRHLIDTANSLADRLPYVTAMQRTLVPIHLQFICTMASCHNGQYRTFPGFAVICEPQYDRSG
jgi:hypothetical protein